MHFLFLLSAAALAAAPAAAQKPGGRTATPQQVLGEMAPVDPMAEAERIAAAAAHPLGSLENPVRVGGPLGARAYIARLRCADGSRPQVGPRRTGGIGAYGTLTELYPLDCGAAAPGRAALAFDFYHEEHVETRPAPGFALEGR